MTMMMEIGDVCWLDDDESEDWIFLGPSSLPPSASGAAVETGDELALYAVRNVKSGNVRDVEMHRLKPKSVP